MKARAQRNPRKWNEKRTVLVQFRDHVGNEDGVSNASGGSVRMACHTWTHFSGFACTPRLQIDRRPDNLKIQPNVETLRANTPRSALIQVSSTIVRSLPRMRDFLALSAFIRFMNPFRFVFANYDTSRKILFSVNPSTAVTIGDDFPMRSSERFIIKTLFTAASFRFFNCYKINSLLIAVYIN